MAEDFNTGVELLYFGSGHVSGSPSHAHWYYQLEYCMEGQISAVCAGRRFQLLPGDLLLIPPDHEHRFYPSQEALSFISIKFNCASPLPMISSHDAVCGFYLDEISRFLNGKHRFSAYSAEGKSIIENHIRGVLSQLTQVPEKSGDADADSEFSANLRYMIGREGAKTTVDSLADNFHASRSEFKYLFLKKMGNGRIKEYIDNVLMRMAENHLRYSAMPVGEVASRLNFSSIYAFSRFYKLRRGMTPTEYRQSQTDSPELQ